MSTEEVQKLRQEYQNAVDNLTAKLVTTEEALMTQRKEFLEMRREWKEMKTELETIPVLQAQVRSPVWFNGTGLCADLEN